MRIHISKVIPQKCFPALVQVRIQAPHYSCKNLFLKQVFLHVLVQWGGYHTQTVQKRPFVHVSVCSQVWESSFPILFEVLLIRVQEETHHFAGWEGV